MYSEPVHQTAPVPDTPGTPNRSHDRQGQGDNFRSVLSTVSILLIAPIIAVLLTAFVFQSYQVDGPSMETTLYNNDRLIVWKLPKTWAKITKKRYIPNRGDVIVFTEPELGQFGQDPGKQLIKRIIGLPGDRVVIKNDVVTVYSAQHPGGFHPDTDLPYQHTQHDTAGDLDVTVPADQVFVLGDNRANSLDSRAFGPVSHRNIIGKLIVRVLPLNDVKRF